MIAIGDWLRKSGERVTLFESLEQPSESPDVGTHMRDMQDFSNELAEEEARRGEAQHEGTFIQDPQQDSQATEGKRLEISIKRDASSTHNSNGELKESPEDIINNAIALGREIIKMDILDQNGKPSVVESFIDANRDKIDIDGNDQILGQEITSGISQFLLFPGSMSEQKPDGEEKTEQEKWSDLIEYFKFKHHHGELSKLFKSYSESLSKVSKLDLNAEQIVGLISDMMEDGIFDPAEARVLLKIHSSLLNLNNEESQTLKEEVKILFNAAVANGLGRLPCDLELHDHPHLMYNYVPTTAKMLLEQLGTNVSEGAITVHAILNGFLTENGMVTSQIRNILPEFGHKVWVIDVASPGEALEKAGEYIDKGHLVAIPVDPYELRYGEQGSGADNAVWLRRIDQSNNSKVLINDSGQVNGEDMEYALEQFINGVGSPLRKKDYYIVVTERVNNGNGEPKESPKDIITEAIETGRQIATVDINGDGKISITETYFDINRDQIDTDGDGQLSKEEIDRAIDTDGDGEFSKEEVYHVLDTDKVKTHHAELSNLLMSHTAALAKVLKLDLNAEQIVNAISDMIEDGTFEEAEAKVLFELQSRLIISKELTALGKEVLTQFDEAVRNGLGELPCDLESHEHQELKYNCVPTTAKMLLERLGTNISEGAITVRAILDGSLTKNGMDDQEIINILRRFGHDATLIEGTTLREVLEEAQKYTEDGHLVAISVDLYELSSGKKDDGSEGDKGSDHVVWLRRIDLDDSTKVLINDSGKENGADNEYPLEQFMNAADDPPHGYENYYYIVVTEQAQPLACEEPLATVDNQRKGYMQSTRSTIPALAHLIAQQGEKWNLASSLLNIPSEQVMEQLMLLSSEQGINPILREFITGYSDTVPDLVGEYRAFLEAGEVPPEISSFSQSAEAIRRGLNDDQLSVEDFRTRLEDLRTHLEANPRLRQILEAFMSQPEYPDTQERLEQLRDDNPELANEVEEYRAFLEALGGVLNPPQSEEATDAPETTGALETPTPDVAQEISNAEFFDSDIMQTAAMGEGLGVQEISWRGDIAMLAKIIWRLWKPVKRLQAEVESLNQRYEDREITQEAYERGVDEALRKLDALLPESVSTYLDDIHPNWKSQILGIKEEYRPGEDNAPSANPEPSEEELAQASANTSFTFSVGNENVEVSTQLTEALEDLNIREETQEPAENSSEVSGDTNTEARRSSTLSVGNENVEVSTQLARTLEGLNTREETQETTGNSEDVLESGRATGTQNARSVINETDAKTTSINSETTTSKPDPVGTDPTPPPQVGGTGTHEDIVDPGADPNTDVV